MYNDEPLWRDLSATTAQVECCVMRAWYSAWCKMVNSSGHPILEGGGGDLAGGTRWGDGARGRGKNLPFSEGLVLRDDPLLSHL